MEDYQEESRQPRQLNLQKVTVAQSSNICFGDFLDDSDFDVTLWQCERAEHCHDHPSHGSIAQDESCEAPSLVIPSSETPLYDALLDKLCHTGDEHVMERLAELCIFDKLVHKRPCGSAEQPAHYCSDPYLFGLRIEHLLSVAKTQRAHQLDRLASRNDARANLAHTLVFHGGDMRETMIPARGPQTSFFSQRSGPKAIFCAFLG